MKLRTVITLGTLAAGALLAPRANACNNMVSHEISDTTKPMVGVFDDGGKFLREIAKADVVKSKVTACNESLGLIQVTQVDGTALWLDPIEVKVPVAAADKPVCVLSAGARAADSKQAVSSGAGPTDQKGCVPPKQ
jgi:hypothetical protein